MEQKPRICALIPARGGSKSIPLKNIKHIAGRPLINWTIDAATKCKYIDQVYVSTDSELISKVVNEYRINGSLELDKLIVTSRSPETATDEASTESVMLEFAAKVDFDVIVLIQATSPLLTYKDLDQAFESYFHGSFDSMLSLVRQKRFIWEEQQDNSVVPVNYSPMNRKRRQEFQGFLVENGAFYITRKHLLLANKCRISGRIGYFEMSEKSYFEVDEPTDWLIIEQLLKKESDYIESNICEKASKIKLVVMDCDGVLTDAGMYYSERGDELKKFNTKDGMGISILHRHGIKTAIITGESSMIVKNRARKLRIDEVHTGIKDKYSVLQAIITRYNLVPEQVAYVGDDINDLEALRFVGLSVAVADAVPIVKGSVDYITQAKGGHGAIREIAELICKAIGES